MPGDVARCGGGASVMTPSLSDGGGHLSVRSNVAQQCVALSTVLPARTFTVHSGLGGKAEGAAFAASPVSLSVDRERIAPRMIAVWIRPTIPGCWKGLQSR